MRAVPVILRIARERRFGPHAGGEIEQFEAMDKVLLLCDGESQKKVWTSRRWDRRRRSEAVFS